ncbi:MAG: hypothetical protein HC897_05345 [Thermoanaerobaculia bacterium]|nr:hypothetical protein [Thermoanaerobaculia bacterium]
MQQRLIASIALIGALAGGTALLAQLKPGLETPHVLPKQLLPKVMLVEDFLMFAHSLSEEDVDMKAHFLGLIGLEPGSEAESALWKAADRVYVLKFGAQARSKVSSKTRRRKNTSSGINGLVRVVPPV